MSRIRSIKPAFWADGKMARELARDLRLFYVGLWNEADDEGRFRANPRRILGALFPYDDDLTEGNVSAWLTRLVETGRLVLYEADGEWFGQLTKFLEHQVINHATPSLIPGPPEANQNGSRAHPVVVPEESGSLPVVVREASRSEVEVEVEVEKGELQELNTGPVEGSKRRQEPEPPAPAQLPEPPPPEQRPVPAYAQKPAWTQGELLAAAKRECGLGLWNRRAENSAHSVLVSWLGARRTPDAVYAAIHGSRALADRGEVDWLKPRMPYELKALNNTRTLANMGDGKVCRLFFDVAEEAYYRALDSPAPREKRRDGPKLVGDVLAKVGSKVGT